jgi:hypothetical protein
LGIIDGEMVETSFGKVFRDFQPRMDEIRLFGTEF